LIEEKAVDLIEAKAVEKSTALSLRRESSGSQILRVLRHCFAITLREMRLSERGKRALLRRLR
jgi:hypothetical protein